MEFCRYTVYKLAASVVNLDIETSMATNAIMQKVCNSFCSFSVQCFCFGPFTEIIDSDHHASVPFFGCWHGAKCRLQFGTMDVVVFRQDEAVLILFEDGALCVGSDHML